MKRAGLASGSPVVTRFVRLHQGAQKGNAANYWALFEPHYKQNLYTNPKRTAKLVYSVLIDCSAPSLFKMALNFLMAPFQRSFSPLVLATAQQNHKSHRINCASRGKVDFCRKRSFCRDICKDLRVPAQLQYAAERCVYSVHK